MVYVIYMRKTNKNLIRQPKLACGKRCLCFVYMLMLIGNSFLIVFTAVPAINKARLWLFTKIPGSNLVYQGRKTLPMLVSRSRCAEECLHEKEFQCLSASYIASHRNNYVRYEYTSFFILCVALLSSCCCCCCLNLSNLIWWVCDWWLFVKRALFLTEIPKLCAFVVYSCRW